MSRTGPGRAVALLLVGAVVVGTIAARHVVLSKVEDRLRARGFSWQAHQGLFLQHEWRGLAGPGIDIEVVAVDLVEESVAIDGVDIELSSFVLANLPRESSGAGAEEGRDFDVAVDGVSVRFGERQLAQGWGGTFSPELSLVGPEGWLRRVDGRWDIYFEHEVALPFAGAAITVRADPTTPDEQLGLQLHEVWVEHRLLGEDRLAIGRIDGQVLLADEGLSAELSWGDATVVMRVEGSPATGVERVTVELSELPLAQVVESFADRVPEASRAEVRGVLSANGTLSLDPLRWSFTPEATGLSASGVLQNVDDLRAAAFAWRVDNGQGSKMTLRARSARVPWTDLEDSGWMRYAVLAAEDAAFRRHPGYDLEQIQVAIDEWATGRPRPRGGSTLTQQLAKNLFLDGDRTLVRKLRELLYALDLERTLGKDAILELYLNVVELGPGIYGIGRAADAYFAKDPKGLTPAEAAFLASLLPSPRRGFERAMAGNLPTTRMDAILDNMVNLGVLSPERLEAERRAPIRIVPRGAP